MPPIRRCFASWLRALQRLFTVVALLLAWRIERAGKLLRQSVPPPLLSDDRDPRDRARLGLLSWYGTRLPGLRDCRFTGTWPLLVMGYVAVRVSLMRWYRGFLRSARFRPTCLTRRGSMGQARWAPLTRIIIPLIALSLITAVLFVFVRTVFELPMSEVLQPTDGPPAPTLIVRMFATTTTANRLGSFLVAILGTALSAGALWLVGCAADAFFWEGGLDAMVGMSRAR